MNSESKFKEKVINSENLQKVKLPLTPEETISEYQKARMEMEEFRKLQTKKIKLLSENEDKIIPKIFYCILFITNKAHINDLYRFYIPFSYLPMKYFETNEEMIRISEQEGFIDAEGYTNYYPVYALINSYHFIYFLDNENFVCKIIREVKPEEISNIDFTEFFKYCDNKMEEEGIEPEIMKFDGDSSIQKKGFFDGMIRFFVSSWNAVNLAVGAVVKVFNENVTVKGVITYEGRDTSLYEVIRGKLPGVWVRFCGTGTYGTSANYDGYYEISIPKNNKYKIEIEFDTYYGWVCDGIIPLVYVFNENYSANGNTTYNINMKDIGEAYILGTIFECYDFMRDELSAYPFYKTNIFTYNSKELKFSITNISKMTNISKVKIEYKMKENGGVLGGYAIPWFFLNCIWGDGFIKIYPNSKFNKSIIAHEYGHYILLDLFGIPYGYVSWFFDKDINYPDNTKDSIYKLNIASLIHEGFAEFFSVVYQYTKYPEIYRKICTNKDYKYSFIENNFGSKDILFYSEISNNKAIGNFYNNKIKKNCHLYVYDFPRYFKEASIFWDLWDDNSIDIMNDYNQFYSSKCISIGCLTNTNFWETKFTNSVYFNSNYSIDALRRKEREYDKICPIDNAGKKRISGILWIAYETGYNLKSFEEAILNEKKFYYKYTPQEISNLIKLHTLY